MPPVEIDLGDLQIWRCVMCRQIFMTGLAMTFLFMGCLLRKDQPVAEQKSIGRILDELAQGKKFGFEGAATHAKRVEYRVGQALDRGLREDHFRMLTKDIVMGGSEAIKEFKKASIRKIFDEFAKTSDEISERMVRIIDELPKEARYEIEALALSKVEHSVSSVEAVALNLKLHANIADDKIFVRLVNKQKKNLDEFAEAVATNHRLADAVGAEIANDASNYGLKKLGVSAEQISSELKLSSTDFDLDKIVFSYDRWGNVRIIPIGLDSTTEGYKFLQMLSGVNIDEEAKALDLLLRRRGGDDYDYKILGDEKIKEMGIPFEKYFTRPIFTTDPKHASKHLLQFYKTD